MVYRGKPSSACKLCRERRIRCDQRRPSCTQCLNAKAQCNGYRNKLDLMFHNETTDVTRKAKEACSKKADESIALALASKSRSPSSQSQPPSPAAALLLSESPTSRAINLFMAAYAGGIYLDYVSALYQPDHHPAALGASVEAVALACLATDQKSSDLLHLARERYGTALVQTTDALHSTKTVTEPETLASVMLLALFAAIGTPDSPDAKDSWSKHVYGALGVLALHLHSSLSSSSFSSFSSSSTPDSAFTTSVDTSRSTPSRILDSLPGQSMLHHIISCVQIDCIQRRARLPPQLRAVYRHSWLNHGLQARFWRLLDRFSEANAYSNEDRDTLAYLADLQCLEDEARFLLETMPAAYESWFGARGGSSDTNAHPDPCFSAACPGYRTTQTWNILRMIRLLSDDLLVASTTRYLSSHADIPDGVLSTLHSNMENASHAAADMAHDMYNSVPEYLRPGRCSTYHPPRGLQESQWARTLSWPLTMARDSPHCPPVLRADIQSQLVILGNDSGMCHVRKGTTASNFSGSVGDSNMHMSFLS
ncbi:hypothetical protein N7474_001024 [Penicillium riverlandense]|uniref:uncharacterized protein n=1 Tax=Penicillium riverlandense TaxID=1903569 RepID=UPI002547498A|nr:uncharacterized protein N7474_001024 [Penicillium riverlandense]KAJ5832713.1 hypothetical protein N7474_001024 [Penicillium riverlandense]